jgi:tetratricopeptide (TPR) repeat protein
LHLTENQLRQLADDRLPAEERKSVVRHLLARCRPCLDLARSFLFPGMSSEPDYSGVLRRLELGAVLAINDIEVERGAARALWDGHLSALQSSSRLIAIRNNPDLQTWGTFELLVAEARRITLERPLDAVDLAYAALAVTDLLDPCAYGAEHVNDFKAGAWGALGNAKRLAGDFQGAGEALRKAAEIVELGTGDPYESANVLSLGSSLLTDLGEFEAAVDNLQSAVALARTVRDLPLEGRFRVKQSSSIGWTNPARGLRFAEQGLKLLRRSKSDDKHTVLGALHLTALWANELGDFEEARSTLETYRYLYATFPDPWTQGRLLLLDGLICRNEGRLEDSEYLLRRLVEQYSEHGMAFDLTLATLEWAESLVLLGRHLETTNVLQEAYPLIEQWGAPVDILRSWKILDEAIRRRVVHHETFRELAMTVRRQWHRRGE